MKSHTMEIKRNTHGWRKRIKHCTTRISKPLKSVQAKFDFIIFADENEKSIVFICFLFLQALVNNMALGSFRANVCILMFDHI